MQKLKVFYSMEKVLMMLLWVKSKQLSLQQMVIMLAVSILD